MTEFQSTVAFTTKKEKKLRCLNQIFHLKGHQHANTTHLHDPVLDQQKP